MRGSSDEYHKLIERVKDLEREVASKDSEIVSFHGERIGREQDHRHLRERNAELEKKLADKDAAIDELTRQLRSMEQDTRTAEGKMSSEKDRLANNYSRDLNNLESEYEQNQPGF